MLNWRRKLLAPLVGAVLASGCTVGPDFKAPVAPVEPDWYQEEREALSPTEMNLVAWWKVFDDPALERLVELAHRQNNTLEIAALRVLEARAQLGIATGLQWPQGQVATGGAAYIAPP